MSEKASLREGVFSFVEIGAMMEENERRDVMATSVVLLAASGMGSYAKMALIGSLLGAGIGFIIAIMKKK